MTHTYATLDVSKAVFDEIAAKLRAAGYDHSFDGNVIDMHGIGLVAAPAVEFVEVPVLLDFDVTKPIGSIRVMKEHLPPTPGFVFALGYLADGPWKRGDIPTTEYVGPYELREVSIVQDGNYIEYLRQVGKLPREGGV